MPTPKGRLVATDFVRFFYEERGRIEILLSNAPDNVEMWEMLFMQRFGDPPISPDTESVRVRPGSTDPRWNTFLLDEKALRIVSALRAIWRKRGGP